MGVGEAPRVEGGVAGWVVRAARRVAVLAAAGQLVE